MNALERIHVTFCSDTHLGFDESLRPRVTRRRRGADFFACFQRVLDDARERRSDALIHGGDLFFRSRVPPAIVDRVYRMLLDLAGGGIPILIVPGNHERSALPPSLFLNHPNIHVFARPETKVLEVRGLRVAVTGVPCARRRARSLFPGLLAGSQWQDAAGDIRLLCLHQAIEGARVGPSGYTFREGDDVIRIADLPPDFDAVLAGHIHRRQVLLRRRPDGTSMPVIYPGSTERTSFAERLEPKGYVRLTIEGGVVEHRFVRLPARPMAELVLPPDIPAGDLLFWLAGSLHAMHPDSIVRIRWAAGAPQALRSCLTSDLLRRLSPPAMNVQWAIEGPAGQRREEM